MDANLQSSLKTDDEAEREQFLSELLLHEAAPLIRIVREIVSRVVEINFQHLRILAVKREFLRCLQA